MQMLGSGLSDLRRWTQSPTGKAVYQYTLKDYVWYPDGGNSLSNYLKKFTGGKKLFEGFDKLAERFDTNDTIDKVARIYIHEFEPLDNLQQKIEKYKTLLDFFDGLTESEGAASFFTGAEETLKDIFDIEVWHRAMEAAIGGSFSSEDNIKYIHEIPAGFYQKLLAGKWIGKFEIPYYDEHFIHAYGHDGWKDRSLMDIIGGRSGPIGKVMEKVGLGNVDIAIRPRFSLDDNGPQADPVEITFHLYNETAQNLAKNIDFLFTIVSGAFWAQSGLTQRASNLYHIYIPGRLLYFFCTMDIEVQYVGKTRKIGANAYRVLQDNIKNANLLIANDDVDSIVDPYLTQHALIPDGYKVIIKLQSIVPNNYNTWAMTYFNQAGKSGISNTIQPDTDKPIGDLISTILENVGNEVQSRRDNRSTIAGLPSLSPDESPLAVLF